MPERRLHRVRAGYRGNQPATWARERPHYPFHSRWLIVKARWAQRSYVHGFGGRRSWRDLWADLIYLLKG